MIPKYEAIAADIRRSIEDGALKPGDKLPTVVEFCELYSVSKITVKRAIEQITEEGLITSRRGSGTYVKDTAGLPGQAFFQGKNDRAQGFSYEHRGEKVTSVVYDFSIVNPPADIAAQLGIAEDDFAYHVVRVRQADGKPIVIEYTYMPLELIPGLKKEGPVRIGLPFHPRAMRAENFELPPYHSRRGSNRGRSRAPGHQAWLSPARAHPDWLFGQRRRL